jgi:hypothetical protein
MTTHALSDLRQLSDDQLLADLRGLLAHGQALEAQLLAHLAEVDSRKLYLDRACASLFVFCTSPPLHMSEDQAYRRIQAARAGRRFPLLLELLADGRLHLTAACLLSPHLTEDNHRELLLAAVHRSKRAVEKLLAARFPQPDVPDRIQKLPAAPPPAPAPAAPTPEPAPAPAPAPMTPSPVPASAPSAQVPFTLTSPAARPRIEPLSQGRYLLKLTVSQAVHDKLLQAQAFLRHRLPGGELEGVLEHALDSLLTDLRRRKFGQTARPRTPPPASDSGSRHIPSQTRRQVVARDGEQCSYVDPLTGRRCEEKGFLEFDHIVPFGKGGGSEPDDVRVLCRMHNRRAAEREYGEGFVQARIAEARAGSG